MQSELTIPIPEEPFVAITKDGAFASHARNDFEKDIFVLKQLVTKDFKIKYRRSFLGVAWSVLNPLLMMVVMSVVFSTLLGSNIEHFPLYLILGNITYSLMSDSTSKAVTSILDAAPLLKKVKIDRFVFEVRHAVEHGTPCPLPGFGTLCPGANGTIAFRYEPDPALLEGAAAAQSAEPEPPQPESPTAPAADPRPADIPQSHAEPAPAAAVPAPSENIGSSPDFPEPRPVKRSATAAFTEPHISPSAKMNPDPSVRGLRYGKPPKNTNAYTYVGRAPRRRADRFIWIAVIAAVLALAAIGYGYYRDMRERQLEEAEWIAFSAPASAAPEASETPAAGDTSEQPM